MCEEHSGVFVECLLVLLSLFLETFSRAFSANLTTLMLPSFYLINLSSLSDLHEYPSTALSNKYFHTNVLLSTLNFYYLMPCCLTENFYPPQHLRDFIYNFLINFAPRKLDRRTQFPHFTGIDSDDNIAQQITEAEAKAPEDLTEEDKMILLGRPKNGDIIRAQLRIKESKEFKVSRQTRARTCESDCVIALECLRKGKSIAKWEAKNFRRFVMIRNLG